MAPGGDYGTDEMADALEVAGHVALQRFKLVDGADWMESNESRLAVLDAVLAFLEKHNPATPAETNKAP